MNEGGHQPSWCGQKEGSMGSICPFLQGPAFGAVFSRMPLGTSGVRSSHGRLGGAGKPLSSELSGQRKVTTDFFPLEWG